MENEDLVNWPNWLCLTFRPQGGEWLNLNTVDLLKFSYRLDVRCGILERQVRFRDGQEREFSLISRRIVHSWVVARSDRKAAWELFEQALHSDFEDIQGGTTPEGIHLGAMAGTVDLIQRVHTGLEMRDDVLWFNPLLPYELSDVELQLRYRGHWLWVRLTNEKLMVSFYRGYSNPVKIGFRNQVYEMVQGEMREFFL